MITHISNEQRLEFTYGGLHVTAMVAIEDEYDSGSWDSAPYTEETYREIDIFAFVPHKDGSEEITIPYKSNLWNNLEKIAYELAI